MKYKLRIQLMCEKCDVVHELVNKVQMFRFFEGFDFDKWIEPNMNNPKYLEFRKYFEAPLHVGHENAPVKIEFLLEQGTQN